MRERDPFAVARTALAAYAAAGRFGWGHPLVATSLANELGLSPTPVREALAHLAGEGIIEHRPGRGYFAPSPTAADIVGLYELHRQLLLWSAASGVRPDAPPMEAPADEVLRIESVFDQLPDRGGNSAVFEAYRRVRLQLRPIRRIEVLLQNAGLDSVLRIECLRGEWRWEDLEELLDEYHEGRIALSAALEKVMRQST
ncbi:GntR family transcriptional regulator [Brevundimonas variabilis]|uniref:DNA-binding Lrp family transcriptional regulator n=1 Tax=Brevundimonas variabilis TaxID=74312 RepID=A0A7W9CK28_9CAUL|nr:GntR family transcriptional regulator [Brevundimonas variabilis]MBB5747082.1 DNA-binding Lrp family transcriptional regulator [Brevundimonas variabilis]